MSTTEISAINYLKEKINHCKDNGCTSCPLSRQNNGKDLYCANLEKDYPEEAIRLLQEYKETHTVHTTWL